MQKKVLWLVILVLILILIALSSVFLQSKSCNPYLSIDSLAKTGNTQSCNCLKDPAEKSQCQANIANAISYAGALSRADVSGCQNISSPEVKRACVNVVQGQIDYAKKALSATSSKQK